MKAEQIHLVKETWVQVVPIADTAAELFYSRLFTIDPTTRTLFRATDMREQRRKLVQVLSVAVNGLGKVDTLVATVEELGRRHAGYGVTDTHYDSVGAALLWALGHGLGPSWTSAAADAWAHAYGLLAGIMRRAAREAEVARAAPAL